MIPKKIHYCWFGGKPLPASAQKCIASWRRFFPDYEIIEWNEDNFPVDTIAYTAEAYRAGKYAFVSDYARFKILYAQGGLYFDTDVEVIAPFDSILAAGPFMGCEFDPAPNQEMMVAAGLGLGAEPEMPVYKAVLDRYADMHFINPDGSQNQTTVVETVTRVLEKFGIKNRVGFHENAGIMIYPAEYFNPLDDATGRLRKTDKTVSIHWFSKSWVDNSNPLRVKMSRLAHRIFGVHFFTNVRNILRK